MSGRKQHLTSSVSRVAPDKHYSLPQHRGAHVSRYEAGRIIAHEEGYRSVKTIPSKRTPSDLVYRWRPSIVVNHRRPACQSSRTIWLWLLMLQCCSARAAVLMLQCSCCSAHTAVLMLQCSPLLCGPVRSIPPRCPTLRVDMQFTPKSWLRISDFPLWTITVFPLRATRCSAR